MGHKGLFTNLCFKLVLLLAYFMSHLTFLCDTNSGETEGSSDGSNGTTSQVRILL